MKNIIPLIVMLAVCHPGLAQETGAETEKFLEINGVKYHWVGDFGGLHDGDPLGGALARPPRSPLLRPARYTRREPPGTADPAAGGAAVSIISQPAADKILDPKQFFGAPSRAYAAAKAIPDLLGKLFCYCGCDLADHHTSLLDCFSSLHAVDSYECQEMALEAYSLNKAGTPLADIRSQIDRIWSNKYPYKTPSPALQMYKMRCCSDSRPKGNSPGGSSK